MTPPLPHPDPGRAPVPLLREGGVVIVAADDLADWQRLNLRNTNLAARAARPCEDCTLGFAADMRAEGRCNGTPGGVAEEDETVEDSSPTRTGRVAVSSAAPCGTCLHAPVCRLRASVEGLRSVTASLPVLDDAVTVSLTAEVVCSHHAREPKSHHSPAGTGRRLSPDGYARVVEANRLRAERQREAKASA